MVITSLLAVLTHYSAGLVPVRQVPVDFLVIIFITGSNVQNLDIIW